MNKKINLNQQEDINSGYHNLQWKLMIVSFINKKISKIM